jgi:hypothetical protein
VIVSHTLLGRCWAIGHTGIKQQSLQQLNIATVVATTLHALRALAVWRSRIGWVIIDLHHTPYYNIDVARLGASPSSDKSLHKVIGEADGKHKGIHNVLNHFF